MRNDEAIDGIFFCCWSFLYILFVDKEHKDASRNEKSNQSTERGVVIDFCWLVDWLVGWFLAINGGFGGWWWLVGWWHTGETEPKNKERKEEGEDEIQTNPLIRWWGNWIDIYYRFDNNTKWHQSSVDSGQKNIHSAADRSTLTFDPDRLAEYRGTGLTFVAASRTLNRWPVDESRRNGLFAADSVGMELRWVYGELGIGIGLIKKRQGLHNPKCTRNIVYGC